MKQWVKKLVDQFSDLEWQKQQDISAHSKASLEQGLSGLADINDERATLLFFIDLYNKHLFEIDTHPVRKVREQLDEFAKALLDPQRRDSEKLLFRIRQFFSTYRIEEYSYIQKTFDDFKNIVWDFADQLSEDIEAEKAADAEVKATLDELRSAIEANSIEHLKQQARMFIDQYVEKQSRKEQRFAKRMTHLQQNLKVVKKELTEAHSSLRTDHLTGAFNRRAFDEEMRKHFKFFQTTGTPSTLALMDIDFFKKINDTFGHDIGDFVLKEYVRILHESFPEGQCFVARTGGEEFAVLFPEWLADRALAKIEEAHEKIRKEVFIHEGKEIRFTMSVGVAPVLPADTLDTWIKRADSALYYSKNTGRNKTTLAGTEKPLTSVA